MNTVSKSFLLILWCKTMKSSPVILPAPVLLCQVFCMYITSVCSRVSETAVFQTRHPCQRADMHRYISDVSIAVIKPFDRYQHRGRAGLASSSTSIHSCRKLRWDAETEIMEEGCLLAYHPPTPDPLSPFCQTDLASLEFTEIRLPLPLEC